MLFAFTISTQAQVPVKPRIVPSANGNASIEYIHLQQQIAFSFRHNSSQLDTLYAENALSYARLREMLAHEQVVDMEICGAASPVGNEEYNRSLSLRRAKAIRDAIKQMPHAESILITVKAVGEEWATFTQHVEEHYHHPNRDKVLGILHSNIANAEKKIALWSLEPNHATWSRLVDEHMDTSRNSVGIVAHTDIRLSDIIVPLPELPQWSIVPLSLDMAAPRSTVATPQAPSQTPTADLTSTSDSDSGSATTPTVMGGGTNESREAENSGDIFERKMVLAARTNLLVPALNVGLEVPIAANWSVGTEFYYPWIWPAPENRNCFELLAWNIEGRYWFGRERTIANRLQGHAVGLYVGGGYYDVQHNFNGHQGEFADVGIDYTYALPVAKGKLHMEFSLGLGYIYSVARPYKVVEKGGDLLWNKQLQRIHYFGPTRLNIALTVPIFKRIKREGGNE